MLLEIGRNEEIYGHVRDSKNEIKEQVENLEISNCHQNTSISSSNNCQ